MVLPWVFPHRLYELPINSHEFNQTLLVRDQLNRVFLHQLHHESNLLFPLALLPEGQKRKPGIDDVIEAVNVSKLLEPYAQHSDTIF